jgi:2-dehydropantoate 2-reductase
LQDFVFVTLKANALGDFAAVAAPLLGPGTGVVFGQNGIPWWYGIGLAPSRPRPPDLSKLDPGGRLQKLLRPEHIIGGVVYSANEVQEPGVIVNRVPGNNMIVVGAADDAQSEAVLSLRNLLEQNDIASPQTADIRTSVWHKIVQAFGAGALCTLTEAAIATVRGNPSLAKLAARLADEGRAIARAHGVDPEAAPRPAERRADLGPDRPQAVDAAGLRAQPADGSRGAARRHAGLRARGKCGSSYAGNHSAAGRVQGRREGPVRGLESAAG